MKFLRHVLNIEVRDWKLDRNPMHKVALPKLHKGRLRFLSVEEEQKQGVMEKVSAFGRQAKQGPILSGTVTGTGRDEEQKPIGVSEAVEKLERVRGIEPPTNGLGIRIRGIA